MAYSSIGHMGYALVGLAAGSEEGVRGVVIYMAIYLVDDARHLRLHPGDAPQRAAMSRRSAISPACRATNPMHGVRSSTILMFSLAGIPPLAGFLAKLYVFLAAIDAELYALAVIGVLASVVGAYYYLRIVKIMYFDEPVGGFQPMAGRAARWCSACRARSCCSTC